MPNYYPFGLEHKGYNAFTSSFGNDKAEQRKFGGTLVSTVLLPEMIAGGGYYSALSKTSISAGVQYLVNDGDINVISAVADGVLIPGAGDAIGSSFILNYNPKTNSLGVFRSVLNDPTMANDSFTDATIGTVFGVATTILGKAVRSTDASDLAKGIGEATNETIFNTASYEAQRKY